ncbi:MAG: hypothetical protein WC558_10585 [Patulibacter sp.]
MSVPATDRATTASSYVPVKPFPVALSSVLSQDQIASDAVLINDANSPNAVATFRNPTKGGAPEAFAIVEINNATQVVYVSRDSSQSTGWSVDPLPGGPNGIWPANSVVAAVTGSSDGLVDVFWDDGSNLQHTWMLPDGTWVTPRPIDGRSLGALGLSYGAAIGPNYPAVPVVYGISGSDVVLLSFAGPGNGWKTITLQGSGFSASNPLEVGLARGANGSGSNGAQATIYSGNKLFGNKISFSDGWSGAAGSVQTLSVNGVSSPVQSVFGQTNDPHGNPVAFALVGGVPYVVSRGGPGFPGIVPIPAATGTVVQAVAVPNPTRTASDNRALSGLVTLYVVHNAPNGHNLSVIRQIGWTNGGLLPQWSPPVPIAIDVDGVYPSLNPADPETIFTADAINDNALAAYTQTVSTPWRNPSGVPEWGGGPHWSGGDVRSQTTNTYDVTSYMVQATVTDANNYPMAGYPLELTASADCGVMIGGTNVFVNQTTPTTVTTDAGGTITVSVLADDFTPPSLILTDLQGAICGGPGQAPGPVSISPGASVQTYMSTPDVANANGSSGVLPYLSPDAQSFGPTMLSTAQTPSGGSLFPGVQGSSPNMPASDAATNINNMMQLGYSPVGDTAAPSGAAYTPAPGSPAGFIINNSDPTRPAYVAFESGDAMRAAWQAQHQPRVHLFHEADHLFSDAWKGIKAGATKVADVAVDVEKGVVSMAIWIGKEATEIGDFVITCVEDACNAITAVFSALESAIKDIIAFLKALFEVGNVFDTQWAFMQAINEGLFTAQELVEWATQQVDPTGSNSSSFFAQQAGQINDSVGQAAALFGGQTMQQFGGANWQPLGQPPNATTPIQGTGGALGGGKTTPAQLTANPQAQWLQSQLGSAVKSSGGVDDLAALLDDAFPTALQEAIDAFLKDFEDAVQLFEGGIDAFEKGFTDLGNAIIALIKATGSNDPNALENVALKDLIQAGQEFLTGMLDFADAIVLSFLGLASAAITWLLDTINSKLPKGHLLADAVQLIYDGLWGLAELSWDAPKNGWTPPAGSSIPNWDPQEGLQRDLTYNGIVSLVLAFPFTILYEILTGKQPFPDGVLPNQVPGPEDAETAYHWVGFASELTVGILTTLRDTLIVGTDSDDGLDSVISLLSLVAGVLGVLSFVFKWPSKGQDWGDSVLQKSMAILGLGSPAILLATGLIGARKEEPGLIANRSIALLSSSLLGSALFVYAIVMGEKAKDKVPPAFHDEWMYDTTIGVLTPIPTALSFLMLPALQEATDDLPIAGAIKLVLDIGLLDLAIPILDVVNMETQPQG